MNVITICNPYPELILLGEKPIENRTQRWHYRGELLIHAGKSRSWMTADAWRRFPTLPYGAIVGVAAVTACLDLNARSWPAEYEYLHQHPHAQGRFCWVLSNVLRFKHPVPCRGAQGLWTVPLDVRRSGRPASGCPWSATTTARRSISPMGLAITRPSDWRLNSGASSCICVFWGVTDFNRFTRRPPSSRPVARWKGFSHDR